MATKLNIIENGKDYVIALRVDKTLADKVTAHKENSGVPVSEFVRRAIVEKLERESVAK
jgi:hypothetical protein